MLGQNRKTDGEHDDDCVKEGLHLVMVKYDRDDEGGRGGIGVGNCGINIWHGSELVVAWSK